MTDCAVRDCVHAFREHSIIPLLNTHNLGVGKMYLLTEMDNDFPGLSEASCTMARYTSPEVVSCVSYEPPSLLLR